MGLIYGQLPTYIVGIPLILNCKKASKIRGSFKCKRRVIEGETLVL